MSRIFLALLLLTPAAIVAKWGLHAGDVTVFVLAALALVPLAWLIGEATEHAAEHTGPGIGGFVNATFGNAPELIIALIAVNQGLPNVVRGSVTGSVVSNLLLVFGAALLTRREGVLDRRSLGLQLGTVAIAVLALLVPSIPGWHGNPDRHSLTIATAPVAAVLLLAYLVVTARSLKRHHRLNVASDREPHPDAWNLRSALAVLLVATVATATVSDLLVHSIDGFADAAHLSQFFVAVVIVAIVGNAAEHGSAVLIAHRGKLPLASEIAVSSSAQVAVLVTPLIALLSFVVMPSLALSFRPVELAAMLVAVAVVGLVIADGRGLRREGVLLVAVYVGVCVAFWFSGDRAPSIHP